MITFNVVSCYIVFVLMLRSSATSGPLIVGDMIANVSVANSTCQQRFARLPANVSLPPGVNETWVNARKVMVGTWTWFFNGRPPIKAPLRDLSQHDCGSVRKERNGHLFYATNCFNHLKGFLCKSKDCRHCQTTQCKQLENSECIKARNMMTTWFQAAEECSRDGGRLLDEDTDLIGLLIYEDEDTERWVGLVKSRWMVYTKDDYKHLTWNPWHSTAMYTEGATCAVLKLKENSIGWTPVHCSEPHSYYCVRDPGTVPTSTLNSTLDRSTTVHSVVLGSFDALVYIGIAVGCAGVFFVVIGVIAKVCSRRRRKSLGEVNRHHFESRPSIFEIDEDMGGLSQSPLGGYQYVNDHPSAAMFDRPMTAGSSGTLGYINKGNPEEQILHNSRTISCSALGRMKCEDFDLMDREYLHSLGDDVGQGSGFSSDYDNASSLDDSQIESTYAIRYRLT